MRRFLRVAIVLGSVAALGAPLAAARADSPPGAPQTSPPPPSTPAAQAPQAPQAQQNATSESDDVVQLVDESLSGIDLRPDQTDTLQSVGAQVDAKVGRLDRAKRRFLAALADQIESGAIDADALRSQIQPIDDAAEAASPIVRSGLERVHDDLTPAQRQQFVSNLRSAAMKLASMVDSKADVDRWASILNLSDEQKQKMSAIVGGYADTVADNVERARADLVLAAYPGDAFSMDELLPSGETRERTDRMLTRVVDEARQVTAILTPAQRREAADAIRARASDQTMTAQPDTAVVDAPPTAAPSGHEPVGTTSQPLWAGGRAVRYRRVTPYGFSAGFASGYGGFYLF